MFIAGIDRIGTGFIAQYDLLVGDSAERDQRESSYRQNRFEGILCRCWE